MLDVHSYPVSPDEIGDLTPEKVLYDFDGPRIFTARDRKNRMLLAYLYVENGPLSSYFVVPFSKKELEGLTDGTSAMLDALAQPWVWDVDVEHGEHGQTVKGCSQVDFCDIPQTYLPIPGTMLWAHLQPLVSLRFSGQDAEPGNVAPAVIKKLVDAATSAVSVLGGYVKNASYIVDEAIEGVFKLRASRFAFRSFEIDFRESKPTPARKLGGQAVAAGDRGDPSIDQIRSEAIGRMGDLLSRGLEWALEDGSDTRAMDAFSDQGERQAALNAVQKLTSVISATVSEVEVGGRLLANYSGKTRDTGAVVLNSEAKARVSTGMTKPPKKKETAKPVWIEGRPARSDKDNNSFVLRDVPGPKNYWICRYPRALYRDVMDCYSKDKVRVFGVPMETVFKVLEIKLVEDPVVPLDTE